MADGMQELHAIVRTGVEPQQTCLDTPLVHSVGLALRPPDVQSVADACDVMHLVGSSGLQMRQVGKYFWMSHFNASSKCCIVASKNVIGATAVVADTQAFRANGTLVDPLSVNVRDQLLKLAGMPTSGV